jgi:hypothetical protein
MKSIKPTFSDSFPKYTTIEATQICFAERKIDPPASKIQVIWALTHLTWLSDSQHLRHPEEMTDPPLGMRQIRTATTVSALMKLWWMFLSL